MTTKPPVQAKLMFVIPFCDRQAFEAHGRGYLSHVCVDVEGQLYPVFFYDPIRLSQDLQTNDENGRPFLADAGMIVVSEITLETMQNAIQHLYVEGFFNRFVPITYQQLALASSADPYSWPPRTFT